MLAAFKEGNWVSQKQKRNLQPMSSFILWLLNHVNRWCIKKVNQSKPTNIQGRWTGRLDGSIHGWQVQDRPAAEVLSCEDREFRIQAHPAVCTVAPVAFRESSEEAQAPESQKHAEVGGGCDDVIDWSTGVPAVQNL